MVSIASCGPRAPPVMLCMVEACLARAGSARLCAASAALCCLSTWLAGSSHWCVHCATCCQVVTSAWWDGARCCLLFCFVPCKCDIYIHASGHDHVHFRRGLQVGLGLGQDWCKDHLSLFSQLPAGTLNYTLLAHEPGSKCKKLYRCASLAMLQHVAVCCKTVTTTTVMSTEDGACLLPALLQLV